MIRCVFVGKDPVDIRYHWKYCYGPIWYLNKNDYFMIFSKSGRQHSWKIVKHVPWTSIYTTKSLAKRFDQDHIISAVSKAPPAREWRFQRDDKKSKLVISQSSQ